MDFIATDGEVEALILENSLIKKHRPRYNIDLKESQRYAYVRITDEPFPRLAVERQKPSGGRFFGPFVSGAGRRRVTDSLNRAFKLRTCRRLPKRACLRYDIGLCSAPCVGAIGSAEYGENVRSAEGILKGRTGKILSALKSKMRKLSDETRYEQALDLREQIRAISALESRQKMERRRKHDEDIINYVVREGKVYLLLFNVYKGTLENKQEFEFDEKPDFLEEFMVQYYSRNRVPREIILPSAVGSGVREFLERTGKGKVSLSTPKAGDGKKLLDLAKKNVEFSFFRETGRLERLRDAIKLNDVPAVIECFDVSHLSGTSTVGSMVRFSYGRPDKSSYRRFRIRTVVGIDDFAAISELVSRRYSRLVGESAPLPNLVVVDGGRGQLNAAMEQLRRVGARIPAIGLAKRLEEIYLPGLRRPLRLSRKDEALKLLQEIRDEAHRFALSYGRLLRKKEAFR